MASGKSDPNKKPFDRDKIDKFFDEILYSAPEDEGESNFKPAVFRTIHSWKDKRRALSQLPESHSVGAILGATAAFGLLLVVVFGRKP